MIPHICETQPGRNANRAAARGQKNSLGYAPSASRSQRSTCFHSVYGQINLIRVIAKIIPYAVEQLDRPLTIRFYISDVAADEIYDSRMPGFNRLSWDSEISFVHNHGAYPKIW